jgi:DNA gyrase subunit A
MAAKKSSGFGSSKIIDIDVAEEMRGSFLEYAYSVIYSRALPDARDGLKPVQRRILFQMNQMGLRPERGHVKSARVVGEVMGRLHPHGDSAIYDALVRMAQSFSLRIPLIDGHGNFGSLDDGPAAMRYTEARLAQSAIEMTSGIDEDVVDFASNYDGREVEPLVLPAALPNLLVNGASGIAVGMATNLAPHNLAEVINATRHLLDNPESTLEELMTFIPGPDFATGGVIIGLDGIRDAYETGKGTFKVRARTRIEQITPRKRGIVVSELPANIGPERVIERVKDLVVSKKLQGISDIVDLTDGDSGLNLIIECKSAFSPEAVLEQLFKLTPMEDSFNINAVALVDGQPVTMGLKHLIQVFIQHRISVVTRRSRYRMEVASSRLHLVAGLLIAIVDIDEVIQVIRNSDDTAAARARLMDIFDLTEIQTNYILEMPLRRLTKFSRIELDKEADQLRSTIEELDALLADDTQLRALVSTELAQVSSAHSSPRRTLLLEATAAPKVVASTSLEIADEDCVVLLSSTGLIARTASINPQGESENETSPRTSHDVIISAARGTSRGELGVLTSSGLVHRISVVDIPAIPPTSGIPGLSGGAPIGAFLSLETDESPIAILDLDAPFVLATSSGSVKRLASTHAIGRPVWDVISLEVGDTVVAALALDDSFAAKVELVCITSAGQLLHFPATAVRAQGRSAGGVAGIKMVDSHVVFFGVVDPSESNVVVTVSGSSQALPGTELGHGKVTDFNQYPGKGRATTGVRAHKFRSGEDTLLRAWCGPAPARAASSSGMAVPLPKSDGKRDGTGTPLTHPIDVIGGPIVIRLAAKK